MPNQKDLFGNEVNSQRVFPAGKRKDVRPDPLPGTPPNKCGNCVHLFYHQYSDKMKYCRLFNQESTAYGKLKIKSRLAACGKFEAKEKM